MSVFQNNSFMAQTGKLAPGFPFYVALDKSACQEKSSKESPEIQK